MEATIVYIDHSSDYRTNRWRVTCGCGKSFVPPTTMMAKEILVCPKCNVSYLVDYNGSPTATIELIKKELK
jgi:hypothetical protein